MDIPTTHVDCCQVNAVGETCGIPNPDNFDVFGGANAVQTCTLVLSNLVLFHAAYKAAYMRLYDICFVTLFAMIWSALYHLCKAQLGGANVCLLPFCTLKHLDYASSNTVLICSILHVLIPEPFYGDVPDFSEENGNYYAQLWTKRVKVWSKFIKHQKRTFIICAYILVLVLLESTLFCSGTRYALLFGLAGGMALGLVLFAYFNLWLLLAPDFPSSISQLFRQAGYNKSNLIMGLVCGVISLVLFFVEDAAAIASYWYLHSLWHVFAAVSETILLDVRTKRRGIFLFIFCESYSGVDYK